MIAGHLTKTPLHEIIVVVVVIIVSPRIHAIHILSGICKPDLLGRSGALLLASLGRILLLLLLLVRQRRQLACNQLDLLTRHLLRQRPRELLQEGVVVGLLGVGGEQRHQRLSQQIKVGLGNGLKQRQRRYINNLSRITGVHNSNRLVAAAGGPASRADANRREQVLGMGKVGGDLAGLNACATFGGCLVFELEGECVLLCLLGCGEGLLFRDALGGRRLVGEGRGGGLFCSQLRLGGLLALFFRVVGGIPGVYDLRKGVSAGVRAGVGDAGVHRRRTLRHPTSSWRRGRRR